MIEMALAKSEEARKHIVRFETTQYGFDFYFRGLSKAQSFASFVARIAPVRVKTSSKLVSTDNHSNTANVRYNVSCDVVPICRDDLLVTSRAISGHISSKLSGKLILVTKCKSFIHCINASPSRTSTAEDATVDFHPDKYWKGGEEKSFRVLLSPSRLVRFIVLDIEICDPPIKKNRIVHSDEKNDDAYRFADVEVVRESDLGVNDTSFRCVTHLGNILKVGDIVLGYDLQSSVLPNDVMENFSQFFNANFELPDVVLVRKGSEGVKSFNNDEKPNAKNRSKSSVSKRRDRRRQKADEKAEALQQIAGRLGLLDIDEDVLHETDEVSLAENIIMLDEEMKNSPGQED
jgi:nonsense-mediated mRNA decay protein 3